MHGFLVKNNVPFDVATPFNAPDLLAWNVILQELDDGSFERETMYFDGKTRAKHA